MMVPWQILGALRTGAGTGASKHVRAKGRAMHAVILAVILTSAPLARAAAQAPVPTPLSLPRDNASNATAMYRRLTLPCQGVALAMRDVGINTGSSAPSIENRLRRGYQ